LRLETHSWNLTRSEVSESTSPGLSTVEASTRCLTPLTPLYQQHSNLRQHQIKQVVMAYTLRELSEVGPITAGRVAVSGRPATWPFGVAAKWLMCWNSTGLSTCACRSAVQGTGCRVQSAGAECRVQVQSVGCSVQSAEEQRTESQVTEQKSTGVGAKCKSGERKCKNTEV
jgi:hypothetical protein